MVSSGNQVEMVRNDETACDKHVVLTSTGPIVRRTWKGPSNLSKSMTITFEHNSVTDIMFVDLCPVANGDNVEIIDVGKDLDFPGQIQARINREKEIFYGVTIQNFSGLKRALQWRYRMLSVQSALRFLVLTLLAGLRIDQDQDHHRTALCP